MKRLLLIVLLLLTQLFAFSQNYKVICVSPEGASANNAVVHKGDVISCESTISWSKTPQAIKLRNIETGEIVIVSNSSLDKHDKVAEYLHIQKKMATDQKFARDSTCNSTLYLVYKSDTGESGQIALSGINTFFGLPWELSLYRDDKLLCGDFRALQADFIVSRRLLSKIDRDVKPSDEDYVLMFDSLLENRHRGLIYSIEEIEMIIKIK